MSDIQYMAPKKKKCLYDTFVEGKIGRGKECNSKITLYTAICTVFYEGVPLSVENCVEIE
jgi:hypothetical protein